MPIYRIENGDVTEVTDDPAANPVDWTESVLAVAGSPQSALALAARYDADDIQPDDVSWYGRTVYALRDPDWPASLIERAESQWGGPVAASRHLGIAYSTWAAYKNGTRVMPEYIRRSVEAHLVIAQSGRGA